MVMSNAQQSKACLALLAVIWFSGALVGHAAAFQSHSGPRAPFGSSTALFRTDGYDGDSDSIGILLRTHVNEDKNPLPNRRQVLAKGASSIFTVILTSSTTSTPLPAVAGTPKLDVNNALAREYTAFPGLFPTIAAKVFKNRPYTSKQQVYAALDSDMERERLKQYDKQIVINKTDPRLLQFKTSQICKYECGGRISSEYRDQQIKAVQDARR